MPAGQQRPPCGSVFENTKLHDDGITLAKLEIKAGEVALSLAPQDPAEGGAASQRGEGRGAPGSAHRTQFCRYRGVEGGAAGAAEPHDTVRRLLG